MQIEQDKSSVGIRQGWPCWTRSAPTLLISHFQTALELVVKRIHNEVEPPSDWSRSPCTYSISAEASFILLVAYTSTCYLPSSLLYLYHILVCNVSSIYVMTKDIYSLMPTAMTSISQLACRLTVAHLSCDCIYIYIQYTHCLHVRVHVRSQKALRAHSVEVYLCILSLQDSSHLHIIYIYIMS